MRLTRTAVLTLAASALVLGGCSSLRNSVGLTKITPDEFLTVSTAPLTVPPEYGLRPPAPGQPRPQELAPESAARQILLGQRQAVTRSPGEQILVATRATPAMLRAAPVRICEVSTSPIHSHPIRMETTGVASR